MLRRTKRQISAFKKQINWHRNYSKDLISKRDFFGPCYLGNKCSDHECILIGFNSECCNKCSLPIHKKNSISQGWMVRDHYYCCRDCHVGKRMTVGGYPYK